MTMNHGVVGKGWESNIDIGDEQIRRACNDDIQGVISVVGWHLYELFETMRQKQFVEVLRICIIQLVEMKVEITKDDDITDVCSYRIKQIGQQPSSVKKVLITGSDPGRQMATTSK